MQLARRRRARAAFLTETLVSSDLFLHEWRLRGAPDNILTLTSIPPSIPTSTFCAQGAPERAWH